MKFTAHAVTVPRTITTGQLRVLGPERGVCSVKHCLQVLEIVQVRA